MSNNRAIRLILLLAAVALPGVVRAGGPQAPAAKAAPMGQSFVATGPSTEADLARLRAAIAKLAGIVRVEVRPWAEGATLVVEGDIPGSLFVAAAKSAGFYMRPMPIRSFAAIGPTGDSDLMRLRAALQQVPGVDKVDLGKHTTGAALRVSGVASTAALTAAGKSAGFALRQLASYVASGPWAAADLSRLRMALEKVSGVEQVEMQGLTGGATLLIYGDVKDLLLVAAAKSTGFALWPLSNASGPREFRIDGKSGTADPQKLQEALRSVEGIGEIKIQIATEEARLVVAGGQVSRDGIVAAAARAGFALTPIDNVFLPSLVPEAERGTPSDYNDRILDDPVQPDEPAPQFTLLAMNGKDKISLSDYLGKKPVVLMFGSCT